MKRLLRRLAAAAAAVAPDFSRRLERILQLVVKELVLGAQRRGLGLGVALRLLHGAAFLGPLGLGGGESNVGGGGSLPSGFHRLELLRAPLLLRVELLDVLGVVQQLLLVHLLRLAPLLAVFLDVGGERGDAALGGGGGRRRRRRFTLSLHRLRRGVVHQLRLGLGILRAFLPLGRG